MTAIGTIKTSLDIPPRVLQNLLDKIAKRNAKLDELRSMTPYNGFDDYYRRQYEATKAGLQNAVKEYESDIMTTARKYLSGMVVLTLGDAEETVNRILAAIPDASSVRMATYVNARMQQVP